MRGLRAKTEIWCHTCWGNPGAQRLFSTQPSYAPAIDALNRVDADVITFETCSSGGMDLESIGGIKSKKVCVGVIDHHTLQVETPQQVADMVRKALKYIPAERLVLASDCGMGREGMSRRHAFHKMVSMVLGANIVRRELGIPEASCLAADENIRWWKASKQRHRDTKAQRRASESFFRRPSVPLCLCVFVFNETGGPSYEASLPVCPCSRNSRRPRIRCRSDRGSGCGRGRPELS